MTPIEQQKYVPDSILAAMRQTNETFNNEVVTNKNFEALDRIYTVNARILPPGAPMIEGRQQIKAFWKNAIAAMAVTGANLTTIEAIPAGQDVLEIGSADLTAAGQVIRVKYVVHWKQEDGNWKWNVDIWNLDQ